MRSPRPAIELAATLFLGALAGVALLAFADYATLGVIV